MSTATAVVEPAVTACPGWCRLPNGHGWIDRGLNEPGDWFRTHELIFDDGVFVQQFEIRDTDGQVNLGTIDIHSESDQDECMTATEAVGLVVELEQRAAYLRQAAALAQQIEAEQHRAP